MLLVGAKERGLAGMLGAPVGEPGVAGLIVAVDQGTDPFVTQADEGGGRFGRLTLADQPQSLGAACRGGRGCLFVALPEFLNGQMGGKLDSSWHSGIIHPEIVGSLPLAC